MLFFFQLLQIYATMQSDSSENSKKGFKTQKSQNTPKFKISSPQTLKLPVPKILVHSASTVMRQIRDDEFYVKLSVNDICFKIRNFGLFHGSSMERLPKFFGDSQLTYYEMLNIEHSNSEVGADDIKIVNCLNDGNSLFRAVADQIFGDQNSYDILRARACDKIISDKRIARGMNQNLGNLAGYILKMRQNGSPGGFIELIALANLLDRTILVFDLKKFDLEMVGVRLPVPQVVRPFKLKVSSDNNDFVRLSSYGDDRGRYGSIVMLYK